MPPGDLRDQTKIFTNREDCEAGQFGRRRHQEVGNRRSAMLALVCQE